MYHLRLVKGLSYSGAVSATKDHPDVFVEDEKKYQRAMKSGYFEEIADAPVDTAEPKSGREEDKFPAEDEEPERLADTLADMNTTELRAYASLNGIDTSGLKKKEEILNAIKEAEKKAEEARAALRSE